MKAILEFEKRVDCVEPEKWMLLQRNEEMLQRLSLTRNHPNGEKTTLLNSDPTRFIGIGVNVEDGIHR